ncbi:cytochrome P450 [Roridomyces roridus]|uniref:Cytochrome P450 n=1 Tax=Roridomyces roridus TaxID=1738132 RepID=A0AAD7BXE7_9AGAR|nr:cytochrome P450 [Roridomyces roridus]
MASLRDYDPLIQKRAVQLVTRLGEQPKGTAVSLASWFELFSYDFMGDLAFGGVFEMLQQGEDADKLGDRIRSYLAASIILGNIPWILGLFNLIPMVQRSIQEFNELGQGLAIRRIKTGAIHTKDLWYHIADEEGREKQKTSLQDAAADGIVGIIAASDTTAHLLTSLMWCLLSNPKYYKRVQQEIVDIFVEDDDLVDFSKHQKCVFLSACINETLRLFPPAPVNGGTRQVHLNSGGGRTIAAKYIPEGTSVYLPTYALHRRSDYFSRPTEFVPDRWLPSSDLALEHNASAFMPFSQGPANCVGQHLARREVQAVIIFLLKTFELHHIYFHKFEPRSAKIPLLLLLVEPGALVLIFGGPISLRQLLLSYTLFWSSLSLSIVLYRLSPFHPLAQYPGPAISKVSKLWGATVAASGKQYLYLKELHDTYGPYVRTGPNELSIVDAAAVSQILNAGGLVKGRFYESGRDPSTPAPIVSLVGDAHAKKQARGAAGDPFGRATEGNRVNLALWFELFTYDFMGDLAFGGVFEMLQQGEDRDRLGDKIHSYLASASIILGNIPWIFGLFNLLPMVQRSIQDFNDLGQGLATHRIKTGAIHAKDLWYHIADEEGLEKQKPTLQEAAADGIVGIIAASDTTAHLLTSLIWCIVSNPKCYKRVQQEIDDMFVVEDDLVDFSKHQQCAFLSACMNETLRLFPSVPVNGGTRQVHPNTGGGRIIAGKYILEGTSVYMPTYVLHRRPDYFSRPTEFNPERWFASSDLALEHNSSAFMPFSQGPANCVGQHLARREVQAVIILLLKAFEVRFADGFDSAAWPESVCDYFNATRGPLLVELKQRV